MIETRKGMNLLTMTISERIKKIRRYYDLTQQEFADRIGSKRNTVATYEMGRTAPSAAVISLICREFKISETWLKNGDGEMLAPNPNDTLDAFIRERNLTTTDRILIEKFASLSIKARWEIVNYMLSLADALWECSTHNQEADTMPPPVPTGKEKADADLAAKVAELERQNQELSAKIAAMEEEDALSGLTGISSKSPSASVGNFSPAQKAKK